MTSPFDLQNDIVRTTHADQSSKAYHISNLRSKTVSELLAAILKDPKCHLSKQKDVQLYEVDPRWTQVKPLSPSDPIEQVIIRLGHAPWLLLIKSESTQLNIPSQAAPKKVYTSKMIKEQLAQYIDRSGIYFCGPQSSRENFRSRPLSTLINQESLNRSTYQTLRPHLETMALHEKMLVSWINQHLSKKSTYISNLHRDLQDGVKLIQLIEAITGKNIPDYHQRPTQVQEKLQNCDLVIRLLFKLGINSVTGVRPKEIYAGNSGIIYGAIYTLICKIGGLPKKKVRKQSQVGNEQVSRNAMFSVMVSPETLAQQLEKEKERFNEEVKSPRLETVSSGSSGSLPKPNFGSSPGPTPLSPRVLNEDGWEEEEGDFVLPENFGAEEIYQNKQQNFGFEEQEVLNDATIQDPNFGINELGPMGWQPLDSPAPNQTPTQTPMQKPITKVLPMVKPGPSASVLNNSRPNASLNRPMGSFNNRPNASMNNRPPGTNTNNRPPNPGGIPNPGSMNRPSITNRPSMAGLNRPSMSTGLGTSPGIGTNNSFPPGSRGKALPMPQARGGKALPTPKRRETNDTSGINPPNLQNAQARNRSSFDLEAEINQFETTKTRQDFSDEIDPSFLATQVQRDRILKRAESVQNKFTQPLEEPEENDEIFQLATRLKNMTANNNSSTTITKNSGKNPNRASLMQLLNDEENNRNASEDAFLSNLNMGTKPINGKMTISAQQRPQRLTERDYTQNQKNGPLSHLFQIEATLDEFGINDVDENEQSPGNRQSNYNDPDFDEFGLNDCSGRRQSNYNDPDFDEFGLNDVGYNSNKLDQKKEDIDFDEFGLGDNLSVNTNYDDEYPEFGCDTYRREEELDPDPDPYGQDNGQDPYDGQDQYGQDGPDQYEQDGQDGYGQEDPYGQDGPDQYGQDGQDGQDPYGQDDGPDPYGEDPYGQDGGDPYGQEEAQDNFQFNFNLNMPQQETRASVVRTQMKQDDFDFDFKFDM